MQFFNVLTFSNLLWFSNHQDFRVEIRLKEFLKFIIVFYYYYYIPINFSVYYFWVISLLLIKIYVFLLLF